MTNQEGLFEFASANESAEQLSAPNAQDVVNELTGVDTHHPLLGSFIGSQIIERDDNPFDTRESLRELERSHLVVEFAKEWFARSDLSPLERALGPLYAQRHSVESINNQFATKLVPCLIETDAVMALENFRSIIPNTIDEELVLLTNDEQFYELHSGLHKRLETADETIETSIDENAKEIDRADRMQFDGRVRRSVERMMNEGMVITIDPANADLIIEANELAGEGILPVTEYVKNGKVLGVSGFMGSKVSLAIHDYMDHLWTFDTIQRAGILDRFSLMFDSIGNPEATDIYKREGEIVASVAFGVRYFQTMPSAFGPLMRSSQIQEHLDKLFIEGKLEDRHMEAYRTLHGLRKGSMEWQSLGFSFSNYITELDQQRRKYGRIKQRDPRTKQLIGELDPLSPDFVCFFIETHHQLLSPKNKHRDDLFRFHILLEEYLTAFANGKIPQDKPFVITSDRLKQTDFTKTTLPPQRIQWMRNNHGFTATRDAII